MSVDGSDLSVGLPAGRWPEARQVAQAVPTKEVVEAGFGGH